MSPSFHAAPNKKLETQHGKKNKSTKNNTKKNGENSFGSFSHNQLVHVGGWKRRGRGTARGVGGVVGDEQPFVVNAAPALNALTRIPWHRAAMDWWRHRRPPRPRPLRAPNTAPLTDVSLFFEFFQLSTCKKQSGQQQQQQQIYNNKTRRWVRRQGLEAGWRGAGWGGDLMAGC